MKKIIASILAAFFVVLSPFSAFASTTEQVYDVSLMSVAPASDFYFYTGQYDMKTDTYDYSSGSVSGLSSGDSIVFGGVGYNLNLDNSLLPLYGVGLKSTSAIASDGDTLRIVVDDIVPTVVPNNSSQYFMFNGVQPYYSFCYMYFTAMRQIGNTHSPTYTETVIPIPNFWTPDKISGGRWDIDISIPVSAPPLPENTNIDRLYNIQLEEIRIFSCFAPSSFNLFYSGSPGSSLLDDYTLPVSSLARLQTRSNSVFYTQVTEGTSSDSSINVVTSIQNSIGSLSTSVNNSISTVRTQITQSTNTITTKIDTMSQDIQTGLQNVVTSAQQNTQNIINTVTTKVDEVKTGIIEVKDSILDLPNKIQEMLLGLIVPDSDTMADKYSEFSGLLEEKLGVIYQIPMMLFDFFDTIVNAATTPQTTLTLPAFQLPWIDGTTLTVWQPMEYKIIPDGMQVLSDLIKTITSMTVVVLTFNSVKRAYERFLRS